VGGLLLSNIKIDKFPGGGNTPEGLNRYLLESSPLHDFPQKVAGYVVWLIRAWREITIKKYSQMGSLSIEKVLLKFKLRC
jgi:hypothetical protein